jgi:hypothetical protein
VEFDFADIGALVGGLPPTAYDVRQWWGNARSVQALAWRDADWHVEQVNFDRQRVRFERGRVGGGFQAHRGRPVKEKLVAAFAPETYLAELDVRVNTTWERAGDITLDSAGGLVFPGLPQLPGVYRISMSGAVDQTRPLVYVGETDNLQRRVAHYRSPGPTQWTNQRIRKDLLAHFRAGGRAVLAVATSAVVEALGESTPLPLARQTARVLVENAALALLYLDGDAIVINKDKGAD